MVAADPELASLDGEEVVNLEGRWVLPGLVSVHTQLLRSLACGQPLPEPPPPAEALWRRFHDAIALDEVRAAVRAGAENALRCGVTTVFEYLDVPSAPGTALTLAVQGLAESGIRSVVCQAVDDRMGPAGIDAVLETTAELATGARLARLVGLGPLRHVSDDTLTRALALARALDTGVHGPLGRTPGPASEEHPVDRLRRLDGLIAGSVFAHGVLLGPDSLDQLGRAGVWLSHHPRADMNAGAGHAPVPWFPQTAAIGTAGVDEDLWAELQTGWLRAREAGVGWSPERFLSLVHGGQRLAALHLGVPLGSLSPGNAADLVVLDVPPGPRLVSEEMAYHLIYRIGARNVRDVMVGGVWRVRGHALVDPMPQTEATQAAESLFARLDPDAAAQRNAH